MAFLGVSPASLPGPAAFRGGFHSDSYAVGTAGNSRLRQLNFVKKITGLRTGPGYHPRRLAYRETSVAKTLSFLPSQGVTPQSLPFAKFTNDAVVSGGPRESGVARASNLHGPPGEQRRE